MNDNKNEPAFPVLDSDRAGDKIIMNCVAPGLSKREIFAKAAMEGLLAGRYAGEERYDCSTTTIARLSVEYADELLTELSKS